MFEAIVDFSIWHLAEVESKRGACITSQISGTARKMDAVIALTRMRAGTEKLQKIAEATHRLAERRNRCIHDPWSFEGGKIRRMQISARKILTAKYVVAEAGEIDRLNQQIIDHMYEFNDLMTSFLPDLPSLREKQT